MVFWWMCNLIIYSIELNKNTVRINNNKSKLKTTFEPAVPRKYFVFILLIRWVSEASDLFLIPDCENNVCLCVRVCVYGARMWQRPNSVIDINEAYIFWMYLMLPDTFGPSDQPYNSWGAWLCVYLNVGVVVLSCNNIMEC